MQLQGLRVVVGPSYRRMLDHDAVHVVRRHKYKVEEGVRTAWAFGKLSDVVLRCEAQNRMVNYCLRFNWKPLAQFCLSIV